MAPRSSTPSISAPRKLNSQVEHRIKRSLPGDCKPNVDRVRQRTDSLSTADAAQSKIKPVLRRKSSEDSQPNATRQRTISTSSVVEFPKATAASQSSIPVRSPSAASNVQRKRLLSRNDDEEQAPRVRQRLNSAASAQTLKGIASPKDDAKPPKERKRLDSIRNSVSKLSTLLDPGRAEPAKSVVSAASVVESKRSDSLKRRSLIATLNSVEPKVRKPFAKTQTPAVTDYSQAFDLESVVDEILANEGVALSFDNSPMCLDDLDEIPDLPLSRPASVFHPMPPSNTAKSNLDRFDVKIVSNKNTEVWDTVENGVYAWEGTLCVTDVNVKQIWANAPPVDCISLECRARDPPSSPNSSFSSSTSSPVDYHATYQGQSLHEEEVLRSMDYTQGITVNKKWERQYSYQDPNKVEWKLRFWVPIPMSLFNKLEDRQFRLRARLSFRDPSAGGMKVTAHSGSVDMSISSLKTASFVRSP